MELKAPRGPIEAGRPLGEAVHPITSHIHGSGHLVQVMLSGDAAPVHWRSLIGPFCRAHGLSDRQKQVVDCIAIGRPNEEIARELEVSAPTVRFHLKSIYRRLGVCDRVGVLLALFEYCWQRQIFPGRVVQGA